MEHSRHPPFLLEYRVGVDTSRWRRRSYSDRQASSVQLLLYFFTFWEKESSSLHEEFLALLACSSIASRIIPFIS